MRHLREFRLGAPQVSAASGSAAAGRRRGRAGAAAGALPPAMYVLRSRRVGAELLHPRIQLPPPRVRDGEVQRGPHPGAKDDLQPAATFTTTTTTAAAAVDDDDGGGGVTSAAGAGPPRTGIAKLGPLRRQVVGGTAAAARAGPGAAAEAAVRPRPWELQGAAPPRPGQDGAPGHAEAAGPSCEGWCGGADSGGGSGVGHACRVQPTGALQRDAAVPGLAAAVAAAERLYMQVETAATTAVTDRRTARRGRGCGSSIAADGAFGAAVKRQDHQLRPEQQRLLGLANRTLLSALAASHAGQGRPRHGNEHRLRSQTVAASWIATAKLRPPLNPASTIPWNYCLGVDATLHLLQALRSVQDSRVTLVADGGAGDGACGACGAAEAFVGPPPASCSSSVLMTSDDGTITRTSEVTVEAADGQLPPSVTIVLSSAAKSQYGGGRGSGGRGSERDVAASCDTAVGAAAVAAAAAAKAPVAETGLTTTDPATTVLLSMASYTAVQGATVLPCGQSGDGAVLQDTLLSGSDTPRQQLLQQQQQQKGREGLEQQLRTPAVEVHMAWAMKWPRSGDQYSRGCVLDGPQVSSATTVEANSANNRCRSSGSGSGTPGAALFHGGGFQRDDDGLAGDAAATPASSGLVHPSDNTLATPFESAASSLFGMTAASTSASRLASGSGSGSGSTSAFGDLVPSCVPTSQRVTCCRPSDACGRCGRRLRLPSVPSDPPPPPLDFVVESVCLLPAGLLLHEATQPLLPFLFPSDLEQSPALPLLTRDCSEGAGGGAVGSDDLPLGCLSDDRVWFQSASQLSCALLSGIMAAREMSAAVGAPPPPSLRGAARPGAGFDAAGVCASSRPTASSAAAPTGLIASSGWSSSSTSSSPSSWPPGARRTHLVFRPVLRLSLEGPSPSGWCLASQADVAALASLAPAVRESGWRLRHLELQLDPAVFGSGRGAGGEPAAAGAGAGGGGGCAAGAGGQPAVGARPLDVAGSAAAGGGGGDGSSAAAAHGCMEQRLAKALAALGPHLERLELHGGSSSAGTGGGGGLSTSPLELSGTFWRALTLQGGLPKLQHLLLAGDLVLPADACPHLARCFPTLSHLGIWLHHFVTDAHLDALFGGAASQTGATPAVRRGGAGLRLAASAAGGVADGARLQLLPHPHWDGGGDGGAPGLAGLRSLAVAQLDLGLPLLFTACAPPGLTAMTVLRFSSGCRPLHTRFPRLVSLSCRDWPAATDMATAAAELTGLTRLTLVPHSPYGAMEGPAVAANLWVLAQLSTVQELNLLHFRTLAGTTRTLQQAVRLLPSLKHLTLTCLPSFSLPHRRLGRPPRIFNDLSALEVLTVDAAHCEWDVLASLELAGPSLLRLRSLALRRVLRVTPHALRGTLAALPPTLRSVRVYHCRGYGLDHRLVALPVKMRRPEVRLDWVAESAKESAGADAGPAPPPGRRGSMARAGGSSGGGGDGPSWVGAVARMWLGVGGRGGNGASGRGKGGDGDAGSAAAAAAALEANGEAVGARSAMGPPLDGSPAEANDSVTIGRERRGMRGPWTRWLLRLGALGSCLGVEPVRG